MSRLVLIALVLYAAPAFAQKPLPPDVLAERLVEAGRKAADAGDAGVAKSRFEEAIRQYGNTPAANAARFGLATLVTAGAEPDYAKGAELLKDARHDGGFADRARASYLYGVCQVRLADKEKDPRARYDKARQAFDEARYLSEKTDAEFSALARCDQADVELRLDRVNEARAVTEPFAKDAGMAKTKAGKRGLYLHGLAAFRLKDYRAASRSLGRAAPFDDPLLAAHAEYLLGRVAHLNGEPAEAEVHYEAAIAGYQKSKAKAEKRLKGEEKLDPGERARLKALVAKAPEAVAAASYQGATLEADAGKFADALPRFERFAKDYPDSTLVADAHLRAGICLVQLKRPDDAIKMLLPLVDSKRLADQAYLWIGKAQLKRARGGNSEGVKLAMECLGHAVERASQAGNTPEGRERRHEALAELADARRLAGEPRKAAEIYDQLWNEQAFPTRREELLARVADAWGQAGEFDRSHQRVEEFTRTYPKSPLLTAMALRDAENSLALAARAEGQNQNREQVARLYEEAAAKFQGVTDKSPDFPRAAEAHFGRAACLARAGQFDRAADALKLVPPDACVGELAATNLLLADCLIRATPPSANGDEARKSLKTAAKAIETFLAAEPKDAGVPGALLKLGHARRRLATTLPEGDDRNRALDQAREPLERLTREFADNGAATLGRVESAKVRAARGDRAGAIADLRPFADDPKLRAAEAAPLAVLQLATLLREANRPAAAAQVILDARQRHEGTLLRDPEGAKVAALLKFNQAVALGESGKPDEAAQLFDQVRHSAHGEPIAAEAALRAQQVRLETAIKKLAEAAAARDRANGDDPKRKAEQAVDQARRPVREGAERLARAGDELRERLPGSAERARLYYEAAWAYRRVAESLPTRANAADLKPARDAYAKLIEQFPESALAIDARLELADLLTAQGANAEAIALLKESLDSKGEVTPEIAAKTRLKLGTLLSQSGDDKQAAEQFEALTKDAKSPVIAQALARAGEAYLRAGDPARAVERLTPFRDDPAFRDRENLSARSLVRLGQAQLKLKQLDGAKKSFDALLERFGQSSLAADARFGLGEVLQAKGDHDGAIKAFEQVADASTREVAARARLRIGLSRVAQKKYAEAAAGLLAVGYEYPESPAVGQLARLEAARALALDGKPEIAREILKKLAEELPETSETGKAARERLAGLK